MTAGHAEHLYTDTAELTVDRIVVPVRLDGGYDRGPVFASRLARQWGAPMHLVTFEPGEGDQVSVGLGTAITEARDTLKAAHPDLDVTDEVVSSPLTPARALADTLAATDLVVMATDAAGEDRYLSFAQELAHSWGGPIVMLGPHAPSDGSLGGAVALAVDGSALAERAAPLATALAARLKAPLRIVQIVSHATTAHVERLRELGEQVSESAYVVDLTNRLEPSPRATWTVNHHDDPAEGLAEFVEGHEVGFLVMATHGAGGIPRPVFGSTTMALVRISSIPVFVVRPTTTTTDELDLRS